MAYKALTSLFLVVLLSAVACGQAEPAPTPISPATATATAAAVSDAPAPPATPTPGPAEDVVPDAPVPTATPTPEPAEDDALDTPAPTATATPTPTPTQEPAEDIADDTPEPSPTPTETPAAEVVLDTPTPTPEPAATATPVPVPISEPGILEIKLERDVIVFGIDDADQSGTALAVGDLNNDGVDDLVLGAHGADPDRRFSAGETYVVFGPLGERRLVKLSTNAAVTFNGIEDDHQSGRGVAVGDINGDGTDDLIIGAPGAGPAGKTYVMFGPLESGTFDLSVADLTVSGIEDGDQSGYAVGTGDINGDGADDLIIGAPGAGPAGVTHVVFGPLEAGTLELSSSISVNGIDDGDFSGASVASGDVNNDGAADLIIGAPRAGPAGEAYVVFGPFEAGTLELSSSAAITLAGIGGGETSQDQAGASVASGDVNNDGADDLIVGAPFAAPEGVRHAGISYVVFGPLEPGPLLPSPSTQLLAIGTGGADPSLAGSGLAVADLNDDGVADLIVGEGFQAPGGSVPAGRTFVLFGSAD